MIEEVAEYPDAAVWRGHDGVTAWLRQWLDLYDVIEVRPREMHAVGEDAVLALTRQRFVSKMGVDLEQDIVHTFRFRDGRLIHATGYRDPANALRALGLERWPASDH